MFREVFEVLGVEGCQRQAVGEGAGGDPRVVRWTGAAAADGVGGDLAPGAGDVVGVGEDDHAVEPVVEGVAVAAAHGRSSARWVSSPRVTEVMHGCLPMICRMTAGGSRRLRLR